MLNKYLLMKPSLRAAIEWALLIAVGLPCYMTNTLMLPFIPMSTTLGTALFAAGMLIHSLSHREHRRAHAKVEEIKSLVTTGIYSKIRHPGYLGVMLAYFGISICFKNIPALAIAFALTILHVLTAIEEEKLLLQKFGKEYEEYMKKVRWRFIPGIY